MNVKEYLRKKGRTAYDFFSEAWAAEKGTPPRASQIVRDCDKFHASNGTKPPIYASEHLRKMKRMPVLSQKAYL